MENQNINFTQTQNADSAAMSKTFISSVFSWMFAALIITSIVSYQFAHNESLLALIVGIDINGYYSLTTLGMIVSFSPLAFILVISMGYSKFSYQALLLLFLTFSAVMGASLSTLFLSYSMGTIYSTFLSASAMFGVMAFVGYTTKTDLTKFGSLLSMAVVGLIIAMVINMFLNSSGMQYIISLFGVLIFTGLTAYDVQKLKNIGAQAEQGQESTGKLIIMGALTLYLDFINLFMFLLSMFGGNRD
jgi:hypothetical protein